jgi:hypothetical protein
MSVPKHLKALALCLVAAFAMSVAMAASASASAPEYGRCVKAEKNAKKEYTGNFSDSKCTKKVTEAEKAKKGKYEWLPGVVKNKQVSVGGKGILEEVGKNAVGCKAQSSTGEYVGTKEVKNVVVKFTECESGPFTCTSEGHALGELETNKLEGRVVWENEASKKVDLELYPAAGKEQFIEFTCGATLTVAVKGAILVPLKTNTMSETVTLKYKAKHGFQTPEFYEEGGKKIKAVLMSNFGGKGFAQAGQNITSTVKNEEKLELNTVI